MKDIDLDSWARRSQFELFRTFAQPHLSITVRVDVTAIMKQRASRAISPFNAMLFCLLQAANTVPELRTRIEGNRVVEHSHVNPSFTVPIEGDQFAFCEIEFVDDWPQFDKRCRVVIERAKAQTELVDETSSRSDWIYLSCLPWLDFSEIRQPLKGVDDSTPRIAWGRIVEKGQASTANGTNSGGWEVAVNVTVHHALVDGAHIGRFFSALNDSVNAI